jgi:ABC-2 type transport system ATP-binding protein
MIRRDDPDMDSPVAELVEITKDYPAGGLACRTLRAVDGVSLRVEQGEVFGLLGPNRAGKTTLIKILLSLCRPNSGWAARFGAPAGDQRTLARIGYVHENHAFPKYLTAVGLLEYYGALTLIPYEEVRRRIPPLLEQVGLSDRGREPIARFSKGMVQRLGIAQALINDPDLLVLDEPSEGLDLAGRQLLRRLMTEQRRRGRSVLLISHVLSEVEQICDRVAVLVKGRLVFSGALADLVGHAAQKSDRPLEHALQRYYEGSPS